MSFLFRIIFWSFSSFFSILVVSKWFILFLSKLILFLSISCFILIFFNNRKYSFIIILSIIFPNISKFILFLSGSMISFIFSVSFFPSVFKYINFFHLLKKYLNWVWFLIIFSNFLLFSDKFFSLLSEIISFFSSFKILLSQFGCWISFDISLSFIPSDKFSILFFKNSSSFFSSGNSTVFPLLILSFSYKSLFITFFSGLLFLYICILTLFSISFSFPNKFFLIFCILVFSLSEIFFFFLDENIFLMIILFTRDCLIMVGGICDCHLSKYFLIICFWLI